MKIKCLVLLVLLLVTVSAHAATQPALTIGNSSAAPMQRVQIPLQLQTQGAGLVTVMMDVKYDQSLAADPAVTLGPAAEGKTLLSSTLPSGALRICIYDLGNKPLADGDIAYLNLTVGAAAAAASELDLSFEAATLGASDSAGKDVPIAGTSGAVTLR